MILLTKNISFEESFQVSNTLLTVLEAKALVVGRPEVSVRHFLFFSHPSF